MTRLIRARGGTGANYTILFKFDLKEDDLVIVGVNVVVLNAGLAEIGEAFCQFPEGCIVLSGDQFESSRWCAATPRNGTYDGGSRSPHLAQNTTR